MRLSEACLADSATISDKADGGDNIAEALADEPAPTLDPPARARAVALSTEDLLWESASPMSSDAPAVGSGAGPPPAVLSHTPSSPPGASPPGASPPGTSSVEPPPPPPPPPLQVSSPQVSSPLPPPPADPSRSPSRSLSSAPVVEPSATPPAAAPLHVPAAAPLHVPEDAPLHVPEDAPLHIPEDGPEDDEPPAASPSAPTAAEAPPTGKNLPTRGTRSRLPRHAATAKPPRPKLKGEPSFDNAPTLDSDTTKVKRTGAAESKARRETETEVQSPDALKEPAARDDGSATASSRPPATTVVSSHPVPVGVSPLESTPAVPTSNSPDKTAAMPSIPDDDGKQAFDPDAEVRAASDAALRKAGIAPRRYNAGRIPTAETLHEEDEDGPTMVAPIPAEAAQSPPPRPGPPPTDEEATQVHPGRLPQPPVTQPPPQMHPAPVAMPPMSPSHAAIPAVRGVIPSAPSGMTHLSGDHQVSAVQTAIDAAAMMSLEAQMLDDHRSRAYDTFAASLLGGGMFTSALSCYLATRFVDKSASFFSVVALTTIAMFVIGVAPLQKRSETAFVFLAIGGVALAFTLIWLLAIAL